MDKYTVERALGAGNYGEVFLVRSRKNGTLLVCKKIDWSSRTPQQQKESENEVKTMAKLNHPNIVGFVEAFVEKKCLHIVMEYADASDLERELVGYINRKEKVPETRIMDVFVQIALALRQVHKQHLLHRDLKSANVFLTSTGQVKLGDFGFAKQLNYTMALASTVCGTPYYFSPELCQRLPYNNKVDVWSLGVILYEMINLQKPFEAKNLPELRKRVVTEDPQKFTATHISPELKDLCMLLLNKSSSQRPSVDAILHLPFVRKHLERFCEKLSAQEKEATLKTIELTSQHARGPNEETFALTPQKQAAPAPSAGVSGGANASFGRVILDKAALKQLKAGQPVGDVQQGGGAAVPSPAQQAPPEEGPTEIFTRPLPDVHQRVSNDCPLTIVSEITDHMLVEQSSRALMTDVKEVLSSADSGASVDDEVLGEAESEEERQLRVELGDRFVKCIELALHLAEQSPTSPAAETTLRQLLNLLGPKAYLLADVQRVAAFFEVDDG
jgi:hypothetical protein